MTASKYLLKWESFNNNICNGLAQLQQREEFVDMTLVAEGHFVKVHKNLMSLASPYLKQMIKAAQCENPTIFFFNMNHKVLCYILEYIYTGEVRVEMEKLDLFIQAASELQLPGISNQKSVTNMCDEQKNEVTETNNTNTKIQILENRLLNCQRNDEGDGYTTKEPDKNNDTFAGTDNSDADIFDEFLKFPDQQNTVCINNSLPKEAETSGVTDNNVQFKYTVNIEGDQATPQQYTVSKRGSLQLILNRYLYSMHHQACGNRKRRWRCVDYRLLRCPAYLDTLDDNITKRQNHHTHAFHDNRIMKKIKANLVYGTLNTVIAKVNSLNEAGIDKMMVDSD